MNWLYLIISVGIVLIGTFAVLFANAQDKLVAAGQIPAEEIRRIRVLGSRPMNLLFVFGVFIIAPGIMTMFLTIVNYFMTRG